MEINPVTGLFENNVPIVSQDEVGFSGLTADSFMRLLITELQNQDPLEPVGNEELLSQLSMMRNLQSNIELSDAVKAVTTNQQLSTAANFIGSSVTGFTTDQTEVSGIADRAFLRDGIAYVGAGEAEIPLSQVTSVNLAFPF